MRRAKFGKVKFDTGVIFNVMIASLLVQKAPLLIDMVIPLDPSVRALAGVGAGYLVGMLMNKSEIANASIAIGAVDFVAPFLDGILGGGTEITTTGGTKVPFQSPPQIAPGYVSGTPITPGNLGDYLRLNDYVSDPSKVQSYNTYNNAYSY